MAERSHLPPTRDARPPNGSGRPTSRTRGSVLIVALLIAALIAVMLGSYLNLNLASTRAAKRTFNGYAALNLAEAGAEEAVWSFNRKSDGDATAWNGWTTSGSATWQKLPAFDLGQNTSGSVKVYVDNINPLPNAQPKIVSQAKVRQPGEIESTKMLEVTLRRRSYFAGGLVAKDSVVFSGANASVDAWNSDPDANPATPPVPYDASVRTDHGSVASQSVINTAIVVNQANIWGYVATGGAQPQVGTNGTIRGVDTPANVAVDPRRVSTDFNAAFNPISAPSDGTLLVTIGSTLGTAGLATKWRTPGFTLSGNDTLTILGDVTLVVTAGSGTDAINVVGNASIIVPVGSSLQIYAEGNVKIGGRGLANSNVQPATCMIWGTNTTTIGQTIQVVGNGALKCAVYTPNGDVTVYGNGDVMGSIVARTITLAGNAAFHYDEALAQRDSNQPFSISKWRELTTAADRARYSSVFDGW
jgi:Tfp pilus assembly protein PilX